MTATAALLLALHGAAPGAQDAVDAARALWEEGRRTEAALRLEQALALRPEDARARTVLAELEIALHRYEGALRTLAPLGAEADPLRGVAHYWLGRFEEAALELDRSDPEQALLAVDALEALGRFEDAARALVDAERALGAGDPRVLAARGRALAREGRHEEAAERFRAALERDPYDREALFGLGRALVASGERDEGLRVLEEHRRLVPLLDELDFARKSLDLEPLHAPNHARVGDVERAIGRLDPAEGAYRRGLALAEGTEVAPIALRLARLLEEDRSDLAAALGVLDDALARVEDPRLPVRAGDLLLRAGDAEGAAARYERALALVPGDEAVRARLRRAREAAERGEGER